MTPGIRPLHRPKDGMGLLDSFERGLERIVNGAFAKTFKSGVQPVEVAAALRRELDTKAAVVARDRILVPNEFTVRLAPADHERLLALGTTLTTELTEILQRHAISQRYTFAGGIAIAFAAEPSLSQGMIDVRSANVQTEVQWTPILEINGVRHPIRGARTVIGRSSEADITVDDTGLSRRHIEILGAGRRAPAKDPGPPTGSRLCGRPVTKALLEPDSLIEIGRTRIVFRVLAQAAAGGGR